MLEQLGARNGACQSAVVLRVWLCWRGCCRRFVVACILLKKIGSDSI